MHPVAAQAIARIKDILDRRILELKTEDSVRRGIVADCMARSLGYTAQAARLGRQLVSYNATDFDRMSQIEPKLRGRKAIFMCCRRCRQPLEREARFRCPRIRSKHSSPRKR